MLLLVFPIAALAKVYQFAFTGGLNFGIMNYILDGVYNGTSLTFKSYTYPIEIYSYLKFLGFRSHLEWSILYTCIFTFIIFCFLLKYKKYSKLEYIYIYSSMFILCWTVMNMNKDLIQLIFMLIIYGICSSKLKDNTKIVLSIGVFLYESIVFREYYILVAGLTLLVYMLIRKEINSVKKRHYIFDLIIIFSIFFAGIYLSKYIAPESYDQLINRRDGLESIENVTTLIKNVIPGENFFIYLCNYLINFVRILFPIEIIQYGFKHVVFFLYQIITSVSLIVSLKNINKKNIVYITIVIAYTIMLAASESDFGTLVRHQSVLMLFYIALFKSFPKKGRLRNE